MMVVTLALNEMLNVRGGDGSTTPPPPPVKTGTDQDIIL